MKTTVRFSRFFRQSSIILLVSSTLIVGEAAAETCPSNLNLVTTCLQTVIESTACQNSIKTCTKSSSTYNSAYAGTEDLMRLDAADGVIDGMYFGRRIVATSDSYSYTTVKYCTIWTTNCLISQS